MLYFPNLLNNFNTMAYSLALFQDVYTYLSPIVLADTPTWNTHSLSGLTRTSFCLATNVNALDCATNPNFSAGGTIQFGYAITNGLPHAAIYGTQKSGLDNYDVTINSAVPEPGSLGLAALGLALTGWGSWRRRKSR